MKKVTMRTLLAGPDGAVAPGQTAEFDDAQARALVAGGYGVYADADPATRPAPPAAPAAASTPTVPAGGELPDGAVAKVLEWVGDDRDRAARALQAEQGQGDKARKSLVDALQRIVGADGQE